MKNKLFNRDMISSGFLYRVYLFFDETKETRKMFVFKFSILFGYIHFVCNPRTYELSNFWNKIELWTDGDRRWYHNNANIKNINNHNDNNDKIKINNKN